MHEKVFTRAQMTTLFDLATISYRWFTQEANAQEADNLLQELAEREAGWNEQVNRLFFQLQWNREYVDGTGLTVLEENMQRYACDCSIFDLERRDPVQFFQRTLFPLWLIIRINKVRLTAAMLDEFGCSAQDVCRRAEETLTADLEQEVKRLGFQIHD